MIKKILSIFIILLAVIPAGAQHCGWDNAYVIIVDVRDKVNGKLINGLEIVLADSNGKVCTSEWNQFNFKGYSFQYNTDTLKLGQNNVKENQNMPGHRNFLPLADGLYMIMVYANNYPDFNSHGQDQLLIRDPDGKANGVFKKRRIKFRQENIVHLCTSNPIWNNKETVERSKILVKMN